MIKLLIFDMDGTLIDSDEILFKTWSELLKIYRPSDSFTIEDTRRFSGPPLENSLKEVFPEYDLEFIRKAYRKATTKYYDTDLHFFGNEETVIKKFYEDGLILTVDTNKEKDMSIKCLKQKQLDTYFSEIIGIKEVDNIKPYPDGVYKILEKFNVKKDEVLFVGDTDFDLITADKAGVKSALMTLKPRKFKHKDLAYFVCDTFDDLYLKVNHYNKSNP